MLILQTVFDAVKFHRFRLARTDPICTSHAHVDVEKRKRRVGLNYLIQLSKGLDLTPSQFSHLLCALCALPKR